MTPGPCRSLVIGAESDPHVALVLEHLPSPGTVVVDAATVSERLLQFNAGEWLFRDLGGGTVLVGASTRGWVRRLAPAGWDEGTAIGSHRAARLTARLALIGALMRTPGAVWLTTSDALAAAENKLTQYMTARQASVAVPRVVVGPSAHDIAGILGEPFVAKPLGVGRFGGVGGERVVYAEAVSADDLAGVDLLDAPFVMQEVIRPRAHLRVVTVRNRTWVCELDASELPMDWRRVDRAHAGFVATSEYPDVARDASRLARVMSAGFTSQDWVVEGDSAYFLDLNPAGQWAFLPPEVAVPVTASIARWLRGS